LKGKCKEASWGLPLQGILGWRKGGGSQRGGRLKGGTQLTVQGLERREEGSSQGGQQERMGARKEGSRACKAEKKTTQIMGCNATMSRSRQKARSARKSMYRSNEGEGAARATCRVQATCQKEKGETQEKGQSEAVYAMVQQREMRRSKTGQRKIETRRPNGSHCGGEMSSALDHREFLKRGTAAGWKTGFVQRTQLRRETRNTAG